MKLDELTKERFEKLEIKALSIQPYSSSYGRYVNVGDFQKWASSALSLLKRVFTESSTHFQNFERKYYQLTAYTEKDFMILKGIFLSAKEDYESGYLFTVRGLVKAEDSTDILEQANDLLNGSYKDASCILAGVALEIAVKEMCNRNGIQIAKLEAMNIELCKKGIYNLGMQKQVTTWAHWRNKAAHGEWAEYNNADVKSMIEGVQRFVSDYL